MRYTRDRKQETRDKLLRSSSRIAKKDGFEITGIDALMAAIAMAGGTLYHHFKSKDALFAALVELEMTHSVGMLDAHRSLHVDDLLCNLREYLSPTHALHPETGCAFTSLAMEISRASPDVRATAERSLKKMHREWRRHLQGDADDAWALLAQCIGAVTLARLVEKDTTRREILSSNFRKVERAVMGAEPQVRERAAIGPSRPESPSQQASLAGLRVHGRSTR